MLRLSGPERRNLLRFTAHQTVDGVIVNTPKGDTLPVDSPDLLTRLALSHPLRPHPRPPPPQTRRPPRRPRLPPNHRQLEQELTHPLDPPPLPRQPLPRPPRSLCGRRIDRRLLPRRRLCRPYPGHRPHRPKPLRILERDPRCRFITYDPANPLGAEPLLALMET